MVVFALGSTKRNFQNAKKAKKAIRIVAGVSYNSHTEPLFKKLQVLPLPDLISFTKIQFMHRFTQNFLPPSFNDTWVMNAVRNIGENDIQLRNHDQLQPIYSNLNNLDLFPLFNFSENLARLSRRTNQNPSENI